jgi:branched-chain amino acid transport system ATP-binding protein
MLKVDALQAGYGPVRVLEGLTLTANKGEVTALLGANGAGKTTLMRTIAGLLPTTSGSIKTDTEELTGLPPNKRVERGISLVPEGRLVFSNFSVEENLLLGAVASRARSRKKQRLAQMYELFPRLSERRRQPAGTLSGGEQQMLAISRALMSFPDILLLDEPTLGLAPRMSNMIFRTIRDLAAEGLTILLAEQNVPRALELARTAYVIEHGHIVVSGKASELLHDPLVRSAYMGI